MTYEQFVFEVEKLCGAGGHSRVTDAGYAYSLYDGQELTGLVVFSSSTGKWYVQSFHEFQASEGDSLGQALHNIVGDLRPKA